MSWKNYSERAQALKASEARRIGKVGYENIARSSTFRWTPQKRNGYYSKQKFSSMRLCSVAKKRFSSRFAPKRCRQKIIDVRTRLRSEKPVIYSTRFPSPTSLAQRNRAGPQWGRPRIQLGGALDGPHSSGRHLADHLDQHVLLYCQDVVAACGSLRRGRRNRSSLHDDVHLDGHRICRRADLPGCAGVDLS